MVTFRVNSKGASLGWLLKEDKGRVDLKVRV